MSVDVAIRRGFRRKKYTKRAELTIRLCLFPTVLHPSGWYFLDDIFHAKLKQLSWISSETNLFSYYYRHVLHFVRLISPPPVPKSRHKLCDPLSSLRLTKKKLSWILGVKRLHTYNCHIWLQHTIRLVASVNLTWYLWNFTINLSLHVPRNQASLELNSKKLD